MSAVELRGTAPDAEMSPPERHLWEASVAGLEAAFTTMEAAEHEALSAAALDALSREAAARAIGPHVAKVAGTGKVRSILVSALARESVAGARGFWVEKRAAAAHVTPRGTA